MEVSVLTLFPDLHKVFWDTSLLKKAQEKVLVSVDIKNLLDFCEPKKRIDAPSFGPGAGMLLKPEVIEKGIKLQEDKSGKAFKIFFSPAGKKMTPGRLKRLAD